MTRDRPSSPAYRLAARLRNWPTWGTAQIRSLGYIIAVAAILRLAFLVSYVHRFRPGAVGVLPFLFEPGNIARSLALGHGFAAPLGIPTGPTAWVAPVYPLLLAGIFHLFGVFATASFFAAALLNIACTVLVCVPLYHAGQRIGGRGLGAGAAWLWAIFPNAVLLPVESMWSASLATLLATTALWLTLRLVSDCRRGDRAAYGLLWGLVLMTDSALLSLLPFLLGWIVHRRRRAGRRWAAGLALSLALIVAVCLPWTLRNYSALHAFVPLRSDLGLALWLGNNPGAGHEAPGVQHPINNGAERTAYMDMGEMAYMRAKRQAALRYIIGHPSRTLRLAAGRFVALWAGGDRHPARDVFQVRSGWFRFVLLFNILAALAALAGIVVLIHRRSPYAWPLAVFPLVYPCAYYFTAALPRYRLPIDPAVLLLAAIALSAPRLWARPAL